MSNQENQKIHSKERIEKVKSGIDLLFKLFELAKQKPLFPRRMATRASEGKMFLVTKKEEVYNACIQSDFLDCRINAYPDLPKDDIEAGLVAPTIVFMDIDRRSVSFEDDVHLSMQNTINKMTYMFNLHLNFAPYVVLWTGGGYHIYLVVNTKPMIIYPDLAKLCRPDSEVNKEFLRFLEKFLSERKNDPNHNVSLESALLRIPGTLNYDRLCYEPNTAEVKVICEPIGSEGVIMKENDRVYKSFMYWCMDVKRAMIRKEGERRKIIRSQEKITKYSHQRNIKRYWWVERLLNKQISENRYFCIFHILGPYLIRIKEMSDQEAHDTIKKWLEWCSKLNVFPDIEGNIKRGTSNSHEFNPISLNTLRRWNMREKGAYRNILNVIEG